MVIGPLEMRFSPLATITRRRLLAVPGEVLVHVGDRVRSEDVVAQAALEGPLRTINIAQALGVSTRAVARHVLVEPGESVTPDTVLARTRRFWGRQVQAKAPCAGTLQGITDGLAFVRQEPQVWPLRAHMPGEVVELYPHRGVAIRNVGALVRGIWGSGPERQGTLAIMVAAPGEVLTWERVGLRYRGMIVVGGIVDDARVLLRANRFRLAGLLVGSIAPHLRAWCQQLALPIVVTEGLGRLPMAQPVFELLWANHGRPAVIAGAEHNGEGGPEVIVPLATSDPTMALVLARPVALGALVRITRPPYWGLVGQVVALPNGPQETPLGTREEGAEVRLADGRRVFVPGANLELVS